MEEAHTQGYTSLLIYKRSYHIQAQAIKASFNKISRRLLQSFLCVLCGVKRRIKLKPSLFQAFLTPYQ